LLLASGALWGTAYVAVKIGLSDGDPYLLALLRFVLGSAVLVAFALVLGRFKPALLKDPLLWAIGILNAVCIALQNLGMTMTTATNTALLFNSNVAFVAILAAVMLKDRLSRRGLIGLAVGMVGVFLISTNGDISGLGGGTFHGNMLVLASGLAWAFCTVLLKKVLDRGEDAVMVTTGMFVLSSLTLVPAVLLFAGSYSMSVVAWESVAWTGIVCTGLAYLAYIVGLRGVHVTLAAIILLSEMMFAVLFASVLLGEALSSFIAVGGALIVASIIVISLPEPGKEEKREDAPASPGGTAK